MLTDAWSSGAAYERYVGRWSRLVAAEFLPWLTVPPGSDWIDVGCGTGALTQGILRIAEPRRVRGYDISPAYVDAARAQLDDERVTFVQADAMQLPDEAGAFHAAVSALALNFVPDPLQALKEMRRVVDRQGTVALYVWDYAEGMQFMRAFWDAAVSLDVAALDFDEGRRFPLCRPEPLRDLFQETGLSRVDVRPIDIVTRFASFDDYWTPFEGGQGPAPGYLKSLPSIARAALRRALDEALPRHSDGSISLSARAWAVKGVVDA